MILPGMSDQTCEKTVSMRNYYPDIVNVLTFDRVMGQVFPQFAKDKGREAHRQNESKAMKNLIFNLPKFLVQISATDTSLCAYFMKLRPVDIDYTNLMHLEMLSFFN